jgi:homoaconitase/3-isopropylmalate dehydratase large subunit
MAGCLARTLIDAHRARPELGERGEIALRIDHVVLDERAAPLVWQAFEAIGVPRVRCELVLTALERDALRGGADVAGEHAALERAARAWGGVLSRHGNGSGPRVHCDRFASPGRTVAGARPGCGAAGGLAALGFLASEIELAAVLAGAPLLRPRPEFVGVRLLDSPGWLGGEDLRLELFRRLGRQGGSRVLEFHGPGLAALPVPERIALAREAHSLGAQAVLFPSDELTRSHLRALGREPDWKPLAEAEPVFARNLDLDGAALEPLVLRPGGAEVVPARDLGGVPVARVVLGSEASVADLTRLAGILAGQHVAEGVRLVVILGSRVLRETVTRSGVLAGLAAAGAEVMDESAELPALRDPASGAVLAFAPGGAVTDDAEASTRLHRAGADTCAASALTGTLTDARLLALEGAAVELSNDGAGGATAEGLLVRSNAGGSGTAAGAGGSYPMSRAMTAALRGPVLLKLGDGVITERILPWGARVQRLAARIPALAGFAFEGLVAANGTALPRSGGFVVAGHGYGAGTPRIQAAAVTVELGIGAVLALSFERSHRDALVAHGVLPLRLRSALDHSELGAGDELEMPDLPEGLEPSKPLVVRNLTRGTQLALDHDLIAREIEVLRAGGVLRLLRASLARA